MTAPSWSEEGQRVRGMKGVVSALFREENEEIETWDSDSLEDKCVGILLGVAVGDALGANLEFKTPEKIEQQYGTRLVKNFKHSRSRPLGCFTDDTEMTLALTDSILACGEVSLDHCSSAYARAFSSGARGYSPTTVVILRALGNGADPRSTGSMSFKDGSFANGSVMRIAPVGLFAALKKCSLEELRESAKNAVYATHIHPEAIDASFCQAHLISQLVQAEIKSLSNDEQADALRDCVRRTAELAINDRVKSRLSFALHYSSQNDSTSEFLEKTVPECEFGPCFAIHAADALGVACFFLLSTVSLGGPELALAHCVSLGGDADTVGCILGAQLGAAFGASSFIPSRWLRKLESQNSIILRGKQFYEQFK